MAKNEQYPNSRFIGKIKEVNGQNGAFNKILIDNPNPEKPDGSVDTYYKGNLIWFDQETGLYYKVKQIALKGVSEKAAANGDINSLMIDLGSSYHVEEME